MICPVCSGERVLKLKTVGGGLLVGPCPDCRASGEASAAFRAEAAYRNDKFPERACDHCGSLYRGPAVYCSLGCAIEDA